MEYYDYLDRMPPFLLDPYYSRASRESLLEMCDFSSKKKNHLNQIIWKYLKK